MFLVAFLMKRLISCVYFSSLDCLTPLTCCTTNTNNQSRLLCALAQALDARLRTSFNPRTKVSTGVTPVSLRELTVRSSSSVVFWMVALSHSGDLHVVDQLIRPHGGALLTFYLPVPIHPIANG